MFKRHAIPPLIPTFLLVTLFISQVLDNRSGQSEGIGALFGLYLTPVFYLIFYIFNLAEDIFNSFIASHLLRNFYSAASILIIGYALAIITNCKGAKEPNFACITVIAAAAILMLPMSLARRGLVKG